MKNLEQYLATAKNYLFSESPEYFARERELILAFVKTHNLEESFIKQVKENHGWRNLSESRQVFYYIESASNRKRNTTCLDEESTISPSINLMIWSGGVDPVIKVVMP
jgi:hypothetical protein